MTDSNSVISPPNNPFSDPTVDPATVHGTDSATPIVSSSNAADPSQKSSLDLLEQLLNESKAETQPDQPPAVGLGEATPVRPAAPTQAPSLEQIHQMEAEQEAEDQVALQAKLNELQQIEQTPAYLARVQQEQTAEQQKAATESAQDGFEIVQLDHTKI